MPIKALISFGREAVIRASKLLLQDERLRKKLIVKYYNISILATKRAKGVFAYDFFAPEQIVKSKHFLCKEEYKGNFFYGISNTLENYCGYEKPIKACIEHGVYFGDYVNEKEAVKSGFPAVITFSRQREKHLRSASNKMIFPIGPYIYYALPSLSEDEINSKKRELGKTLLFFPSHSIERVETQFDIKNLIEQIQDFKAKHNFQTVIVCLYYRDVELGRCKVYRDAGFLTACCGRREDPAFLRRQKSLLLLADYTASNSIGTHIGYSILLHKPHTVFQQKIKFATDSRAENRQVTDLYMSEAAREKSEVECAFTIYSDVITKEQERICNRYWGNNLVLEPHKMKYILQICEEVYTQADHKESKFEMCEKECINKFIMREPDAKFLERLL